MGVLTTLIKSAIPSAILGLLLYGGMSAIIGQVQSLGKVGALLAVGVGGLAVGWAYYGITKLLGMPETKYVRNALRRGENAPAEGPDA
jgi:hypothetical protein